MTEGTSTTHIQSNPAAGDTVGETISSVGRGGDDDQHVRIEDLVSEAIDGTIPDSFLDARMGPEGQWE